jgi:hypothetical protein
MQTQNLMNISHSKKTEEADPKWAFCGSKIHQTFYQFWSRPFVIADVMLYNVEIAQTFASENTIKTICFSRVCSTFEQAVIF